MEYIQIIRKQKHTDVPFAGSISWFTWRCFILEKNVDIFIIYFSSEYYISVSVNLIICFKYSYSIIFNVLTLNIFFNSAIVHQQVSLLEFILMSCTAVVSIDAFESWLKYKHRTGCLKKLSGHGDQINSVALHFKLWLKNRWNEFLFLRETNHTKVSICFN